MVTAAVVAVGCSESIPAHVVLTRRRGGDEVDGREPHNANPPQQKGS
jgi:hypothetical protein